MNSKLRDETLADLYYIAEYARVTRENLLAGKPITPVFVSRMADLAARVRDWLSK